MEKRRLYITPDTSLVRIHLHDPLAKNIGGGGVVIGEWVSAADVQMAKPNTFFTEEEEESGDDGYPTWRSPWDD